MRHIFCSTNVALHKFRTHPPFHATLYRVILKTQLLRGRLLKRYERIVEAIRNRLQNIKSSLRNGNMSLALPRHSSRGRVPKTGP